MNGNRRWIGRGEALARLGVKPQTLYAYVSRGRISARPDPENPRRSLYAVSDLDRLTGAAPVVEETVVPFEGGAARGEAVIHSGLTAVIEGRPYYRGADVVQLSETATLEDAARRLWRATENPFAGLKPRISAVTGGMTRARLFAALARRAEEEPAAVGRAPEALRAEAAAALNEVIDAIAGPGPRLHFHQRLARGWKIAERDAPLIRRALVLAADHRLDAAVIATRSAADGGAAVAGAALAGLAAASGGAAMSLSAVSAWIVGARRDPAGAARRGMAENGGLPGFDAEDSDPRAAALLEAVDLPADLAAVVREGEAATGNAPGFDLALALLAWRLDLPREGACDLYLIARLAGLLGHALDQRIDGSPIRARLRYVGPRPGAN